MYKKYMQINDDTIAAVATAPGAAGIAIVRISGPDSLHIADRIVRCRGPKPSERQTHTAVFGTVSDGECVVDEVICLVFKAPQTYTKEDVIEIQCHGGHITAQRILRRVLRAGARSAEPGEFTARAFLNGRMDLLQAEAVLDLIHAESERSAKSAVEQLEGALSRTVNDIYERMIRLGSDISASLDFPEEEIPPISLDDVMGRCDDIKQSIRRLMETYDEGRILRNGARVVIAGRPNAGKSTLLNVLLETERAITSHIPGTTRDTIEEAILLDGLPVRLIDTAGIQQTECEIEREGIRRSRAVQDTADIVLYVIDIEAGVHKDDIAALSRMTDRRAVALLNKIDRTDSGGAHPDIPCECLKISLKTGAGVDALRKRLKEMLEEEIHAESAPHPSVSARHYGMLAAAREEMSRAADVLGKHADEAFYLAAVHLREGARWIARITGRIYEEDMLDQIFSRFCIGK